MFPMGRANKKLKTGLVALYNGKSATESGLLLKPMSTQWYIKKPLGITT